MKILVLHGPNLNLLGKREPEVYGKTTLAEINAELEKRAVELDLEIRCFQSNHEGVLIDTIHEAMDWANGILINPGGIYPYQCGTSRLPLPVPESQRWRCISLTFTHGSLFAGNL